MKADRRPEWSQVTAAGRFRVPRSGGTFDRHYHDCDEYWLIYAGRAKVMTEGEEFYVGPGDIVCTRAGDEHDVVEVYEDLEAFFFEDVLFEGGRAGHLHRSPELAERHEVTGRDVPAGFVRRA
ncbi:cupin domain-containing protein [Jiangella asiatica]|nr:cupin domain-containing protein [Jiangella asiatica]